MKRSGSDSGLGGPIPLKRMNSTDTNVSAIGNEEDDDGPTFFLRNQNRQMAIQLMRYKRQISESRKELEMMRDKSREMESLVSVIQRAWSQVCHPFL